MRPHSKYLMEYFAFLYEFAKMGDQECFFLLHINAISTMVSFYMGQKAQENYVSVTDSSVLADYRFCNLLTYFVAI